MKLLDKGNDTVIAPEFHKPLNLEYKVSNSEARPTHQTGAPDFI